MIGLWDTTGNEVVKALAAERRSAGGVASGMALTLIVVVDEKRVREAEAAATIAAAAHPCRLVVVVRSEIERDRNRLDAEIVVGGRLGPCEAVVTRMYGRLALHAESVVMPLLVPDVPVVTWWHGEPPAEIATDFLGVVADRRITDAAQAADPIEALRQRARDYAPGDTDLAWTRITPWRTLVAGAFDTTEARVTEATVVGAAERPDGGADGRLAGQPGSASTRAGWTPPSSPGCGRCSCAAPTATADAHPGGQHGRVPAYRAGGPDPAAGAPAARRRAGRGAAPARRRPGVRGGAGRHGRADRPGQQRPPERVHVRRPPSGPRPGSPRTPARRA